MKTANAKIKWLLKKKEIPPVRKSQNTDWIYNTILIFKDKYDLQIWNCNKSMVPLWTAIVNNEKIRGTESIATIRYLVDEAPQELMQPNAKFELFDGKIKIADGIIIDII